MMLGWRVQWVGIVALLLCASAAWAQQNGGLQIEPQKASLACLLPAAGERGAPEYPEHLRMAHKDATVTAKLTFDSATAAPRFKVLSNTGSSDFQRAVAEYVQRYRLPCFDASLGPIETTQVFEFRARDSRAVHYSDVGQQATRLPVNCIATAPVTYPPRASLAQAQGNVLLGFTFTKKGEPPEIQVLYGGRNRDLQAAAVSGAKNYRLNCDIPADAPVLAKQLFVFYIDGSGTPVLRDVTLPQFLGAVDRADLGAVKFDFNTMACPFDVNIAMHRPYTSNSVGEYGETDPRRASFIAWLSKLTMRFPKESEPSLVGASIKVTVPCMLLDLT